MVRVFVRVEHRVHQADLFAQQLLAQVGRGVDQQIAARQAQHRRCTACGDSCGLVLRQTSQPQPIAGTPTLVPVPNRIIWPLMSVLISWRWHEMLGCRIG